MGKSTNRLVVVVLFLGMILVSFNHCLGPTATKKSGLKYESSSNSSTDNNDTGTNNSPPPPSGTDSRSVSIQAFSTTVHPLTRNYCINCHGSFQTPLHAVADPTQAHDAVIDAFKINFDNIPNSRMVLKLRDESHNCWGDCAASANEMEMAIQNWKTTVDAAGGNTIDDTPDPVLTTSESRTLLEELDPENATDNGTIVVEADSASLKAPMVAGTAGSDTYIHTPNGNGGNLGNNNAAAGIGYINFDTSFSDVFKIYALVDAPSDQDNSFHMKVDNGNYQEWHIDVTAGFEWREVTNTNNQNPVDFFIPAGSGHILEVRQREDGTKIQRVVISNNPNINLNDVSNATTATISYDISAIVGVTAFFSIDVQEYDMYSYKLTNPTIESSFPLRIKNIQPLINGSFNPQHATYTLVDMATGPGTTVLSPRALIALKDQGTSIDKLSFSFEVLQQN